MKSNIEIMFPPIFILVRRIKGWYKIVKFKIKYPRTRAFVKPDPLLYSQENQDYIIYNHFFKKKVNGVYCDVGGNHPVKFNNTKYFEEQGWDGYVFEPLPHMKKLWSLHRKAKYFPYAASDKKETVKLSIVDNIEGWEDMLSFVSKNNNKDKLKGRLTKDIEIQAIPLKEVFKKESIERIDYMSIDVEGHELSVLKGIDFDNVRISVLSIENNSSPNVFYGDPVIRDILLNNGYIYWGRILYLDDIFVHKDFMERGIG